jgi:hypothetical protein
MRSCSLPQIVTSLNLNVRVPIGFSGDYIEGETPVPIPNTAVKPLRADGTGRATVRESRSLPGILF